MTDTAHAKVGDDRDSRAPASPRDPATIARFIERFAAALADAGFPRMPARVFAGLLTTDSGRLSAAELAEMLQVSPAAISGAVRYLVQINLAVKEREPGARRDHYWVRGDVWQEALVQRDEMMRRWAVIVNDGVAALGPDTPAGNRLAETQEFFEFLQAEWTDIYERWQRHRASRQRPTA